MEKSIKFYYNGIKVNGESRLTKCWFGISNDGEKVYINAREYDDLPRGIFDVVNESDPYTDYFDQDHTTLTDAHPLYKYAKYYALKSRYMDDKKHVAWITKRGGDMNTPDMVATLQRMRDFEQEQDPGQPTAADLEKIDQQRQKRENDAREAAQLEQQRMQEQALIERVEGEKLIKAQMEAHPIKDGEPTVLIHWSEHPAFYGWKDDELVLSVAAADRILGTLDMQQYVKHQGYDKTKFSIMGTDPDGEPINYTGRYDLGDGERGLIKHIHNFGSWYLTHDESGHELSEPLETNGTVEFAAWLKQFTA